MMTVTLGQQLSSVCTWGTLEKRINFHGSSAGLSVGSKGWGTHCMSVATVSYSAAVSYWYIMYVVYCYVHACYAVAKAIACIYFFHSHGFIVRSFAFTYPWEWIMSNGRCGTCRRDVNAELCARRVKKKKNGLVTLIRNRTIRLGPYFGIIVGFVLR